MSSFKSLQFFSFSLSRKGLFLIILFPFLVIAVAWFVYHKKPFLLVDRDKDNLHSLRIINDNLQQGKSNVRLLENRSDKLSYQYTLSDAFLNPYGGVEYVPDEGAFFDLSEYDYLKIKIRASKGKRISFSIGTRIEIDDPQKTNFVYFEKGVPIAFRLMSTALNVDTTYQQLSIPVKQLVTPEWWYTSSKLKEKEVAEPDYSQAKFVYFGHCIALPPGIEDTVELEEIGFYKGYTGFYITSVSGLAGYFIIIGLLLYKRKRAVEVNFQHGKITSDIPLSKEEEAVFGFITSNYMKQELSIAEIQRACGYSENKITEIIKAKTGMNFKAFLNKLRISETKRLLMETDFTISEIAEKVGYGNVTHFNRVFKASEGKSPNEFKKEHKAFLSVSEEKV